MVIFTWSILPPPSERPKGYCGCLRLSVCPPARSSVCKLYVARTITRHIFELESPNLHQACILSACIENEGHWPWPSMSFWPFWLRILGNSACPRDNSSQIWAGITKFAPNIHPAILSVGIENGGHWPWPSKSLGYFDSEFQETAFNVALVYWSRPANGCYASQTYFCFSMMRCLFYKSWFMVHLQPRVGLTQAPFVNRV